MINHGFSLDEPYRLDEPGLAALLLALQSDGHTLIGPRVRDGAIVYAPIEGLADLPRGFRDEQMPGRYRLGDHADGQYFGFAAPVQSLKPLFQPAKERLLTLRRSAQHVSVERPTCESQRFAIIGARACDLEGLSRLDHVLLEGPHPDVRYRARRDDTLIVAVHCTVPAQTCFCASMDTGPRAKTFDLALTEVSHDGQSCFVLEVGSDRGAQLVRRLKVVRASAELIEQAAALVQSAAEHQQRRVDPLAARESLARSGEHPHWQSVAERCLACTNCTASCPTCFCSTVQDEGAFDPEQSERWRHADSCFNSDFSYIHGGSVRSSVASRYRQWLTHKFSTWHDQFGSAGCVGCGRCIAWCPVGIDVTEELAVICASDTGKAAQ